MISRGLVEAERVILQSHTKRHAGIGVVDVDFAFISLIVEIVKLRLDTKEVVAPVVDNSYVDEAADYAMLDNVEIYAYLAEAEL
jgi:hypothetical protein